ncbi:MAG: hypothetical protein EHM38_10810 [Geobacteraceae bacterium]|jgi:hypothetical protein|nr:MAG: hypothetical protein EHM38_10810 [Geobacteraceae bacterium]
MDYFQGVVTEYLRAKRSVFVNTEFMISLDEGDKPKKDRHWYCDVIAVDFKTKCIYLCEITYSTTTQSLLSRLQSWRKCWDDLAGSIRRDSGLPNDWTVVPWVFLPKKYDEAFRTKFAALAESVLPESKMPAPRITHLESTLPWEYRVTWDRQTDDIANGGV